VPLPRALSKLVVYKMLCGIFVTADLLFGRLLRVDLMKWVSNVCPYVRPSTKSFFNFNETWYVGRGRQVMHDGMQYDPIQGLDLGSGHTAYRQGHEPLKVGNSAIFKRYLLCHLQWGLASDHGFLN